MVESSKKTELNIESMKLMSEVELKNMLIKLLPDTK